MLQNIKIYIGKLIKRAGFYSRWPAQLFLPFSAVVLASYTPDEMSGYVSVSCW